MFVITGLVPSQIVQTKSKSHDKFNSFVIITIMYRIGHWSCELKNVFHKCRETVKITKARIQFIPFGYIRYEMESKRS